MDSLHPAKREMIEAGGRTAQSFGLSRLLGQIYTLLYLNKGALSLDAIAESLGVSKASVSIACRQLESWGAVKRSWVKGDRRDYYVAETDFRRILGNGLLGSVLKKLDSAKVQIERSLGLLESRAGDSEDAEFLRDRLKEAEEFRNKISRLLDNPIVRTLL
ncbi:MAG: HTH-type transcriptional repressor OpcR [bacterium ADurb.Bin374]|nr:MAG: HTH-type transcriptional repressor OpcR [bacterium ADurb.Bin374]